MPSIFLNSYFVESSINPSGILNAIPLKFIVSASLSVELSSLELFRPQGVKTT